MKYLKYSILAILFSVLTLSFTSCVEKKTASAYIEYGEESVNLKANPYIQSYVNPEVTTQNYKMMHDLYTFSEAKAEFDRFIKQLKKDVESQGFPVMDDTWTDLILHWMEETYTLRLTINPNSK